MSVHEALRRMRVVEKVGQVTLAKALGVSSGYISLIENGHRSPSLSLVKRWATYFGYVIRVTFEQE